MLLNIQKLIKTLSDSAIEFIFAIFLFCGKGKNQRRKWMKQHNYFFHFIVFRVFCVFLFLILRFLRPIL